MNTADFSASSADLSGDLPLESLSDPAHVFIVTNSQDKILTWGERAAHLFGRTDSEALGENLPALLLQAEGAAKYNEAQQDARQAANTSAEFSCDVHSTQGDLRTLQWSVYPLPGSEPAQTAHFLLDLEQRRRRESLMRRALSHHQRLLRSLRSIVISVDLKGRVTEWNLAAERVFGLSAWATRGLPLAELPIGWPRERVQAALSKALASQEVCYLDDLPFRPTPEDAGVLGLTMTPVHDDEDAHHGVLILGADVTSRRSLENQLQQAQRLESIGRLAAGIAHEINTPTQFVGDNIRFLRDSIQDLLSLLGTYDTAIKRPVEDRDAALTEVEAAREESDLEFLEEEIPSSISQSLEGVERIASIVRAMKEFSHPSHESKAPSDLNQALQSTLVVARNEWKYVADVQLKLDPELPAVPCHLGELNQVFLNLVVNAAHAVHEANPGGDKGNIEIRTRCEGSQVIIEVQDDGCGMDELTCARAFDPFFTTKPVGRGTGQGLALAHDVIVNKHQGLISVSSRPGEGSTFMVRLPMGAPNVEAAAT